MPEGPSKAALGSPCGGGAVTIVTVVVTLKTVHRVNGPLSYTPVSSPVLVNCASVTQGGDVGDRKSCTHLFAGVPTLWWGSHEGPVKMPPTRS